VQRWEVFVAERCEFLRSGVIVKEIVVVAGDEYSSVGGFPESHDVGLVHLFRLRGLLYFPGGAVDDAKACPYDFWYFPVIYLF